MRVLFNLPEGEPYDVVITFRGGSRLPFPLRAPELGLLKPEWAPDIYLALSSKGDTRLETLAAVSARFWRETYALAHFVDYEPPQLPRTAFALDPDLGVVAAKHLSQRGYRVLVELPALSPAQAHILAGVEVDVLCTSGAAVDAADSVLVEQRAAAARSLRDVGMLGGAWFRRVSPRASSPVNPHDSAWAVFESYRAPRVNTLPEPRQVAPLLDVAPFSRAAVEVMRDVVLSPLPLRTLGELNFDEIMRDLVIYGYARMERDVLRGTEKALFALAQAGKLTGPPPVEYRAVEVRAEGEEGGEEE